MNKDYEVIVAGGGTAGVIAAIAAARNGAKTLVIERFGHLGGTAVYGIPFLGMYDGCDNKVNAGIAQELIDRMKEEGGSLDGCFGATWMDEKYRFSLVPFEPEVYKYVAQEMLLEAACDILFYTVVTGVTVEGDILKSIEVFSKSGKETYSAKVFIDCTGDADIAYMCNVPMQPKDRIQNASILFKMGNVDMNKFLEALKNGQGITGWKEWHNRVIMGKKLNSDNVGPIHLAGHFVGKNGKEITFTAVSLIEDEVYINATRTINVDSTNVYSLTKGEISERRNVHEVVNILKESVPGFEKSHLINSSPIGIRESRNIVGEYTLQKEDVLSGKQFEDSVARGAYPIDIHDPKGGRTSFQFIKDGGSYSIPYRCFIPKGFKNLLVAGRCLSATHEAVGTARIMGACMAHGQAVGTAAALAVKTGVNPASVDISALQDTLIKQKALI